MDIVQWAIIIIAVGFIMSRFMPVKGIENITSQEAKKRFKDKNIQFVDVRTPGEYKGNHKKPFVNIPLHELSNRTKELDKQKEVVVICQSGMRSMKAAKLLKKQGFGKITNVKGGMSAWF
ncbi:rhodanese-like domain-containing protein [Ornithinibacillus halophilus]|uniref:Rhodanese domain-containing protein n=1 Tax=Ornithinibacillus halophilus TaxID=930117 RepID=A0A1M5F4S0_9BACI|nr:rhodanese-like domain-containing protein [Ornithinibacillus halophilus]SHF86600.1 hypothetical protein SAMN05216225_100757 [Ornithinibacillus halophilus]